MPFRGLDPLSFLFRSSEVTMGFCTSLLSGGCGGSRVTCIDAMTRWSSGFCMSRLFAMAAWVTFTLFLWAATKNAAAG